MLVFADVADFETWSGVPAPDNVDRLLRSASIMVREAVKTARFDTTPAGLPSDPDIMEALRDATCAQAVVWDESGIVPGRVDTTPALSSTGLDGSSMGFDTATAAQVKAQASTTLCAESATILDNAGLIGGHPWTW